MEDDMFDIQVIDHFDELIRAAMDEGPVQGSLCLEISRFGNGNIQFSYDTGHDHIDILAVCRFRQSLHDRLYKLHGNRLGGLVGLTIETDPHRRHADESLAICVTFAPLE
jgi:hypothetical protein